MRRRGIELLESRCVLAGDPLLISEFMTANATVLKDQFQEYGDWIELYNPTDEDVELEGWRLTDDSSAMDKWQFPEISIGAQQTLVVFASGRDRTITSQLHTNFKLTTQGEYLALVRPDGTIAHDFSPSFPPQRGDISFGVPFDENGPRVGESQYFVTASPNAPNGIGVSGFASDALFGVERGFFDEPFTLSLSTSTPFGQIRYTTDGSVPTRENGNLYTGPVNVDTTATIRAAAFAEGLAPSNTTTQTYIFLDSVLQQTGEGLPEQWGYFDDGGPPRPARMDANYEVDPDVVLDPLYSDTIKDDLRSIPTLSIVLDPDDLWDLEDGIYANPLSKGDAWERPASFEWINTEGETEFATQAGLKIHGGAARRFSQNAKLSFRIDFQGLYGAPTLDYPMFGTDGAQEYDELVLRGGFNDSWKNTRDSENTYLRDGWARQAQIDMGGYAPRNTWVNLYLNGLYWGLYSPTERPNALWASNYRGGSPDEYDVINTGSNIVDGNSRAWDELNRALSANQFDYNAIKGMVDIESFIDYLIVNQFVGNWDWPQNNWYASRHRVEGGKWFFHTWDAEAGFQRGVGENRVDPASDNISSGAGPGSLYLALLKVAEFRDLYADRIQKHFFGDGQLMPEANSARLNSMAADIDRAIVGESARWGDGKDDAGRPLTRDRSWIPAIKSMIGRFFSPRHDRILDQFREVDLFPEIDGPLFDPVAGNIASDTDLRLTTTVGDVYYTVDGSDPHGPDGRPSQTAIRLNTYDLVAADSPAKLLIPDGSASEQGWQSIDFDDSGWQDGLAAFGYDTGVSDDLIEVPRGFDVRAVSTSKQLGSMSEAEAVLAGEDVTGTTTVSGVPWINYRQLPRRQANFDGSLDFPRPEGSFVLDVTAKIVVAETGIYTFGVTANDGSKLLLDGKVLYADADGHPTKDTFVTTELTAGEHDINLVMFQRAGTAELVFFFARGEKTEFGPEFQLVGNGQHRPFDAFINTDVQASVLDTTTSVYTRISFQVDDLFDVDRVELRMNYDDGFVAYLNGTEVARDLAPDTLAFDSGSSGTRGDVAVIQQVLFDVSGFQDILQIGQNVLAIHGLNTDVSDVDMLISPQLVAFRSDPTFQLTDSASVKSRAVFDGTWTALAETNFSLATSASGLNLRISELQYHPQDPSAAEIAAGFDSANDFEFIELVNISNESIDLSRVELQQTAKSGDIQGVEFRFGTSDFTELGPGQRVLVVEDRKAFEFRYGEDLPVAGQWSGGLSNSSETVTLVAGDELIHRFAYRDQWYPTTDGGGYSLERIDPNGADLSLWANAAAWRPSIVPNGSPGIAGDHQSGDANRDGAFNTEDLLLVLQAGEYVDGIEGNSSWEEGDWNNDGDFNTLDLVLALATNRFEAALPPAAVAAAMADEQER